MAKEKSVHEHISAISNREIEKIFVSHLKHYIHSEIDYLYNAYFNRGVKLPSKSVENFIKSVIDMAALGVGVGLATGITVAGFGGAIVIAPAAKAVGTGVTKATLGFLYNKTVGKRRKKQAKHIIMVTILDDVKVKSEQFARKVYEIYQDPISKIAMDDVITLADTIAKRAIYYMARKALPFNQENFLIGVKKGTSGRAWIDNKDILEADTLTSTSLETRSEEDENWTAEGLLTETFLYQNEEDLFYYDLECFKFKKNTYLPKYGFRMATDFEKAEIKTDVNREKFSRYYETLTLLDKCYGNFEQCKVVSFSELFNYADALKKNPSTSARKYFLADGDSNKNIKVIVKMDIKSKDNDRKAEASNKKTLDLTNANFEGVVLTGVDFSGVKLYVDNGNFKGCNLERVVFGEGACLRRACFTAAWCVDADFSYADLDGATFVNANVAGANFNLANLSNTTYIGTNFKRARNVDKAITSPNKAKFFTDVTDATMYSLYCGRKEIVRQQYSIKDYREAIVTSNECLKLLQHESLNHDININIDQEKIELYRIRIICYLNLSYYERAYEEANAAIILLEEKKDAVMREWENSRDKFMLLLADSLYRQENFKEEFVIYSKLLRRVDTLSHEVRLDLYYCCAYAALKLSENVCSQVLIVKETEFNKELFLVKGVGVLVFDETRREWVLHYRKTLEGAFEEIVLDENIAEEELRMLAKELKNKTIDNLSNNQDLVIKIAKFIQFFLNKQQMWEMCKSAKNYYELFMEQVISCRDENNELKDKIRQSLNNLGVIFIRLAECERSNRLLYLTEAESYFKRVNDMIKNIAGMSNHDKALSYYNLGEIYLKLYLQAETEDEGNEYQNRAITSLQNAIIIDNEYVHAHNYYGMALKYAGQLEDAKFFLGQALIHTRNDPCILATYGEVLLSLAVRKDNPKRMTHYKRAKIILSQAKESLLRSLETPRLQRKNTTVPYQINLFLDYGKALLLLDEEDSANNHFDSVAIMYPVLHSDIIEIKNKCNIILKEIHADAELLCQSSFENSMQSLGKNKQILLSSPSALNTDRGTETKKSQFHCC